MRKRIMDYDSVNRWVDSIYIELSGIKSGVSRKTIDVYLYYLGRYCRFLGMNPDEIISDRLEALQSRNPMEMARHDDYVRRFIQRELVASGASPNTIATAVAALKSFYKYNYAQINIRIPRAEPVNPRDIPTREEVSTLLSENGVKLWVKTWIVSQCQSGLSLKELKSISVKQIEPLLNDPPIVMPMYRGKEHVHHHMVLGSNAAELIKQYIRTYRPRQTLFPYSDRGIQIAVKQLFRRISPSKNIVPHSLRKFFVTNMKLAAKTSNIDGLTPILIEYWVGHRINKTESAYFIPPVEEQRRIYSKVEHIISFF